MSNRKERNRLQRTYGTLYARLENCNLDECWYCNSPRESLDHCPPLHQIDQISLDKFVKSGGKLQLIPCCLECNNILGSKALLTPLERLIHLYNQYNKKVDKFFVDWNPSEIKELGSNLKRMVLAKQTVVNGWVSKIRKMEINIIAIESGARDV